MRASRVAMVAFAMIAAVMVLAPTAEAGGSPFIGISLDAVPDSAQDFTFFGDLGAFMLDDDTDPTLDEEQFFGAGDGTYVVGMNPVPGWRLTEIDCSGTGDTFDVNLTAGTVEIEKLAFATFCTFSVAQTATLIIDKVTAPAGDPTEFDFEVNIVESTTVASFSLADQDDPQEIELLPGNYEAVETVPADWALIDTECTEGFADDIDLSAGEVVTCTFVNQTTEVAADLSFAKEFSPDTIGGGSTTTLTFTIDNTEGAASAGLLTFTDVLPEPLEVAGAPNASTNCGTGVVDALPGGDTINFSFGSVAAGDSCTVSVDVVGPPGEGSYTETNTTGDLTSTLGSSGTATDDLMVVTTQPGFSKSFSPATVDLGERSTLTFTIDNSLNGSDVDDLSFIDNLPAGMVVADPANATTDCVNSHASTATTLTATPGSSVITLDADGNFLHPILDEGATCTVSVDVTTTATGSLGNVSDDLFAEFDPVGRASATLTVVAADLNIAKDFVDDPIVPGGTATLQITIENFDRDFPATAVAFTDTLPTTPSAVTIAFPPMETNTCGGTLTAAAGTGSVSLTGGSVPAEGTCTITVDVTAAGTGTHLNTISDLSGTIDGETVSGNTATENLYVVEAPILTKEFTDDPVSGGETVTLEFTITDTTEEGGSSDITFNDNISAVLDGVEFGDITVPAPGFCGDDSTMSVNVDDPFGIDEVGIVVTGASLDAGESCTFSITIVVPARFQGGTFTNTTSQISATVDEMTVIGNEASDDVIVIATPELTKEFTDDPIAQGGTATLEFTITHDPDAPTAATDIGFTDDLSLVAPGLTFDSLDFNDCGGTVGGVGTTLITVSDATVAAGASCTIRVSIASTGSTPVGTHTNRVTDLAATVAGTVLMPPGIGEEGTNAEDDLVVSNVTFTKEFIDDPIIPGDSGTLRFRLDNAGDAAVTLGGLAFTDNLNLLLPGTPDVTATLPPTFDDCGGTLTELLGTLSYSGGTIPASGSCTIDVTITVPEDAASGTYTNITSTLTTSVGTVSPAIDDLEVNDVVLELTKEFTDDPAIAGGTVTLVFTIENLSDTETITDIAFSDDLDATLPGLEATGVTGTGNTCGGMATSSFPTGLFGYSDGTLGPEASCTITLEVELPDPPVAPGAYPNTTSAISGSVGLLEVTGSPATDDLTVVGVTFTKSFDGPVVAGTTGVLTFTITNLDTVDAVSGLAFSDDLAAMLAGVEISALPADGECGSGSTFAGTTELTLIDGEIGPGGSCTFDVAFSVPADATPDDYDNTTSALLAAGLEVAPKAADTLTVEAEADLSVTKDDGVPSAVPGEDTITYTIEVANDGPSDDPAVSLTDTFPADLTCTYTSIALDGASSNTAAGSGDLDETLDMPAGSSVIYTVTCTIDASATGTLSNTAEVDSSEGVTDPVPGNNSSTDDTVLAPESDLSIDKTDDPDPVVAGETLIYTITVENAGPSDATNVVVNDSLHPDFAVQSTSGCAEDPSAVPNCTLGTIPAGGSASYTITVLVDPGAEPVPGYLNFASVTTDSDDPDTSNDSVAIFTEVIAKADLSVTKTDDPDPVLAGETVTYTVTVDNAGPSDASGVIVTDTLPAEVTYVSDTDSCVEAPAGTLTCDLGAIVAGGSASFDVTVTVNTSTAEGPITNSVSVSSATPDPNVENDQDQEDTTVFRSRIDIEKSTNGVDADLPEDGPEIVVGSPVIWTYVVTNTGLEELFDIMVVDDELGPISCPETRLAPGVSMTCTADGTAVEGDYDNEATAAGTPDGGEPVSDSDPSHYTGVLVTGTAVIIDKSPELQVIPIGGTATWTITVTNIGSVPTDFTVEDPLAPDCNATTAVLAGGASESYECSLEDVTESFGNTALIPGTEPGIPLASDTAEVIAENGALDIVKSPETQSIPSGGMATWTITVTNTGRIDLTDVEITDPLATNCNSSIGDLAADETASYICSRDGITETFTNVITATGSDGETTVTGTDDAEVVILLSGLEIEKTPESQEIAVGGTATFQIRVRNTGTTDLDNVEVTDPAAPDCATTIATLAAGQEVIIDCTVDGVTDSFENVATASVTGPGGETISVSDSANVIVLQPGIEIRKLPSFQEVAVGGTADFAIFVINTGRGPLTDVVVEDPMVPGCSATIGNLAEGEEVSYPCSAVGVTAGFVNVATVTASSGLGEPISASDNATVAVPAGLTVVKTALTPVVVTGEPATFEITVVNSTSSGITDVVVTDGLTPDCNRDIGTLEADSSFTYQCTTGGLTGDLLNVAAVTGKQGTTTLDDLDSALVEVEDPSITIEKSPASQFVDPGGTASWTITITNNNRVALTDVTVTDLAAPNCDRVVGTLGAGAVISYTCTLTGVTGPFTNVATVTAKAGAALATASASADVNVFGVGLAITKEPPTQTVAPGGTAKFTITVTNTSTAAIDEVSVADPLATGCARALGTLEPGAVVSYECELPGVDASLTNVASVVVGPAGGEQTVFGTDSGEVVVSGSAIGITKTALTEQIDPGGTATWQITVTNNDRAPIDGVVVSDPQAPDCDRTIGTLAVGESVTYTCTLAGVSTGFTNVATANGTNSENETVTSSDDAVVNVTGPSIGISKSPASQIVINGGTATWTIAVVNTGDVELTNVVVSDPQAPNCARSLGTLAREATVTYSCTLENVTDSLTNSATASGTAGGTTVEATATAAVVRIFEPGANQLIITSTIVNGAQLSTSSASGGDRRSSAQVTPTPTATFTIVASAGCTANPTTVTITGTGAATVMVTNVDPATGTACTYTVTAAPIAGFTLSPLGAVTVNPGAIVPFVFTAIPTAPPAPPGPKPEPALPYPGPFDNAPASPEGAFGFGTTPNPQPSQPATQPDIPAPPLAVTGLENRNLLMLGMALLGAGCLIMDFRRSYLRSVEQSYD